MTDELASRSLVTFLSRCGSCFPVEPSVYWTGRHGGTGHLILILETLIVDLCPIGYNGAGERESPTK